MELPKYYYGTSHLRNNRGHGRERGEKMLVEMLRQRQEGLFGGRRSVLGGRSSHPSPFPGAYNMHPMMGGYPRHGFPPPMGMDMSMSLGGMGMGMGMNPYIGMGGIDMGGIGIGTGPGQPPLGHSPFGHQQHSPFSYGPPGPPRAHSFFSQHRHSHSPFSRSRQRPFSSSRMMFDEDDYRIPPRRGFGRQMRGDFRFAPRHSLRRRGYQPSMFEESEDDYGDDDSYDDDYYDEEEIEEYFPRRLPYMRLQRGY
jgi:hypothetical protein